VSPAAQSGEGTAVTIGTMTMTLRIPDSQSLKDKRRVLLSLKDQVRNRFNVSVAEVDAQDQRQQAVLAFAIVSGDGQFANTVLNKIVDFVRKIHQAQLVHYEIEML